MERAEVRLEESRPVFALVREWCEQEATEEFRVVITLRQEVDRLQGILKDLALLPRSAAIPRKPSWC